MEQNEVEQVNESYKRCLKNPHFFDDFYKTFMAQDAHIIEKFKNTDMNHQMAALRHGLQYMIMFASGSSIAAAKVEDLAVTHDRNHRNIPAHMYDAWLTSLLATIQKHDPECTDNLLRDWRNVLSHGIMRMKTMF